MSRLMSVSMTEQAVVERRKTVTRRKGWWKDKNGRRILNAGDRLTLCRKVMGRKPGEPLVRLAEVEVVSVRRERLGLMLDDPAYGLVEVYAEGVGDTHNADEFIREFFTDAQRISPMDDVTRIEWRYL